MGRRRVDNIHFAFYPIGFIFHNGHLPIWVSLCFGYDRPARRVISRIHAEGKTFAAREGGDSGGYLGQLLGGMVVLSALVPVIIKTGNEIVTHNKVRLSSYGSIIQGV